MGDVIQANAVERLLGSVAPGQCFWYGHPMKEVGGVSESFGAGRFFGRNASRVIPLDDTSASVVSHPSLGFPVIIFRAMRDISSYSYLG